MIRALRALALSCCLVTGSLVLGAGVSGCFGPTLPLPPPTALVSAPDAEGIVTLTGSALPDAYVLALNVDTDVGVIGRADAGGRYSLRVAAEVGHTLEVWQMSTMDAGQHTTVLVPAP